MTEAAEAAGATKEVRGAPAAATTFSGRARAAQLLINGAVGAVWVHGGQPRVVFEFMIADGRIVAIDALAEPTRLGELDLVILND